MLGTIVIMQKTVILSPHFDDAVFSCWNLLHDKNVSVITVFAGIPPRGTRTLWDRVCGEADSKVMVLKRIEENKTVLKANEVKSYNFNFLDRQYRQDKLDVSKIVNSILKKTSEEDIVYYAPLAGSKLWRHPDHIALREVGKELLKKGESVYFYADIPYMQMPSRTYESYIKEMDKRASALLDRIVSTKIIQLTSKDQKAKVKAMKQYKTQYKMTNLTSFGSLSRRKNIEKEIIFKLNPI